jgi:hypothetical protein
MTMDTSTKTVVVIGHGRSGTSMVSGILNIVGVKMDFVHNPNKGNPKGDFESQEVVRINDAILREANGDLDYFLKVPSHEEVLAVGERYGKDILEYLKDKSGLWGFKDPRTSLTLSLYLPYLENLHVVHVYRNKESVVASQLASSKDKFTKNDIEKNLAEYEQRISEFKELSSVPWIDVSFEGVLQNPVAEAKRLADFVGISTGGFEEDVKDFVIPREKIQSEKKRAGFKELLRKIKSKLWKR